jgi:type I restriction enzyme S subunit
MSLTKVGCTLRFEIRAYGVRQGDVFFTRTSETVDEIGIAAVLLEDVDDGVFSGFVLRARPKSLDLDLDLLFKKYCFDSEIVRKQITSTSSYTTRALTNGRLLSQVILPCPPELEEQRAIATALSDVDALIAALDKLIAKKRHLKTATMQQLLTGKKRLPGFGEGKWLTRPQKEVCSYINGRAYQRSEWETYGTPVVRLQNLTGSGDEYYYSNLQLPEHQYMDHGDLIFMWSASFGPYIWKGSKAIYHYHIWKIDCDLEQVDKTFYYYKLVELTENIKKGSNGSTMAHVTKGEMENFSITLPEDVEEQRAIATVLSDMDAEIAALEARRAKTQAIKQGMMQQLLTGKVRLLDKGIDN